MRSLSSRFKGESFLFSFLICLTFIKFCSLDLQIALLDLLLLTGRVYLAHKLLEPTRDTMGIIHYHLNVS